MGKNTKAKGILGTGEGQEHALGGVKICLKN